MRNFVLKDAQEFDRHFMQTLFGKTQDNRRQLYIIRCALADIIENELTDRQKEMVHLYYYEGKNSREISEQLYVNKSTVSRTLYRARERIRKNLRFYFDYKGISVED